MRTWCFALISILGAAVSIITFAPGVVTPDSIDVMNQIATGQWTDWHSPFFTAIFGLTMPNIYGPYGILMLNCTLLWAACGVLAYSSAKRYGWRSLSFFLVPIIPATLFAPAFAWDISLHSMTWLFALSLAFPGAQNSGTKRKAIRGGGIIILIFLGVLLRKNGWFAAVPLFWCALLPLANAKVRMALVALFFLLVPVTWSVVTILSNPIPLHAENSIKTYDIGAISARTGKNLFPGVWTEKQDKDIVENCHASDIKQRIIDNGWDLYAWGRCSFVLQGLSKQNLFRSNALTAAWLSSILNNPLAYLEARLNFFGTFMIARRSIPVLTHSDSNTASGWDFRNTHAIKAAYDFADPFTNGALFMPLTWLVLASLVFFVAVFSKRLNTGLRRYICCISASGVVWLLTYLNFGVAYDFRYAFWTVYVAFLSVIIIFNELLEKKDGACLDAG